MDTLSVIRSHVDSWRLPGGDLDLALRVPGTVKPPSSWMAPVSCPLPLDGGQGTGDEGSGSEATGGIMATARLQAETVEV